MISVDRISCCDGGRTGFISGPWSADKTRSRRTGVRDNTVDTGLTRTDRKVQWWAWVVSCVLCVGYDGATDSQNSKSFFICLAFEAVIYLIKYLALFP